MARTPFKLRSNNSTSFKQMGSSPVKQDEKKKKKESVISIDDVAIFDSDTTHHRTTDLYTNQMVHFLKRQGISAEGIKALAERNDRIFKAGKAQSQKGTDEER